MECMKQTVNVKAAKLLVSNAHHPPYAHLVLKIDIWPPIIAVPVIT